MANLRSVVVIDVHRENLQQNWPSIVRSIRGSTFLALDAELSGLGNRKLLNARAITDRYKEMKEVASTRAILSLGLSCFKLVSGSHSNHTDFEIQTYNIILLCSENYVVEPLSLSFLVQHGFDFNKQYALGIPYYRGEDKAANEDNCCIRQLFRELLLAQVPIVFHNAVVDLVFLHQHFYAPLPPTIEIFLAQIAEMFKGGVYDTKYISEFQARMSASFLEYVFRKCQKDNHIAATEGAAHVRVYFPEISNPGAVILPCALTDTAQPSEQGKTQGCVSYASYGWCSNGTRCSKSHDIDFLMDNEHLVTPTKKRKKSRPRIRDPEKRLQMKKEKLLQKFTQTAADNNGEDKLSVDQHHIENESSDGDELTTEDEKPNAVRTGGHRAGFDSFMTGFAFAHFIVRFGENATNKLLLPDFHNKIALSGKDRPLLVQKSTFAKVSKEHLEKQERLNSS